MQIFLKQTKIVSGLSYDSHKCMRFLFQRAGTLVSQPTTITTTQPAQPAQPAAQPAQPAAQPAQLVALPVSQQRYLHSPNTYGQIQSPYPQASQQAYPYPQPQQSSAQPSAYPPAGGM